MNRSQLIEYVIPLEGKMAARLEKGRCKFEKQRVELLTVDGRLWHCADIRGGLDLDDGVKVESA